MKKDVLQPKNFLMLTIAYEGELADVDAFDQPGVEVYKKLMKAQL